MADAAISFAVEKLGDALIQKVIFLKGVEEHVRRLKEELKRMQCFLKDATEKQANDERIRNWVSEIREVAHDAEDAIETFILKVENARRSRGMMGRCARFPVHVHHINRVGKEIESIRTRLEDIERSRQTYGIQNLGQGMDSSSRSRSEEVERRRRLAPWEKDKHLVGLNADVDLLLQQVILKDREGLSIAAIVGMGGIGKSTLARKIYHHIAIAAKFDCRAWVVVSSEFTPEDIIKQIMLQLQNSEEDRQKVLDTTKKMQESMNDKLRCQEMLQEMLRKHLEGKRYFIVLDDVWEHTHWESMRSAFPDEQDKASKLLFTSRNQIITKNQGYIHQMKLLDHNASWELLLKTAFISKTDHEECPRELENIGREILKKCEGLPLAIRVAGGLLANEGKSKSGWEKVIKEIKNSDHVGRSEISNKVSAILELSYRSLPPELKACFQCLGFFKEDATIRSERLVHIWIALGFVPQVGEEMMEEIARGYLDELINRNMVQVKDMTTDNRIKNCLVHDLIRELSITKAKEEISFEILREEANSQSSCKPRHRAVYCSEKRFTGSSTNQNKQLRSLVAHGVGQYIDSCPSSSYWKSFELLKVLYFDDFRVLYNFPEAIGTLIGLRYLGLRSREILSYFSLPRSLGKLKNLEVLDLRNCAVVMPNDLKKMDSLRHLYAYCISYRGRRHLKIETSKSIQTLKYINLSNWIMVEHSTEMTSSLHKLGINMDEWSYDKNKLFTSLAMLENLVCLKFRNSGYLHTEGLATLHRVTQLKLDGQRRSLPSASDFPPNLSYLSLTGTKLDEDPMPLLEKLPKLLYLKLGKAYMGKEMVISHDGFPRLEVLSLQSLWFLRNIQVGEGAMSELKQLKIYDCKVLMTENLPKHLRSAITNIN